jgi:hypothetical protein
MPHVLTASSVLPLWLCAGLRGWSSPAPPCGSVPSWGLMRIEAFVDELAASAYDVLSADELDELVAGLEPIAATARAVDH